MALVYSNHKSSVWNSENKFKLWQKSHFNSLEEANHQAQESGLI